MCRRVANIRILNPTTGGESSGESRIAGQWSLWRQGEGLRQNGHRCSALGRRERAIGLIKPSLWRTVNFRQLLGRCSESMELFARLKWWNRLNTQRSRQNPQFGRHHRNGQGTDSRDISVCDSAAIIVIEHPDAVVRGLPSLRQQRNLLHKLKPSEFRVLPQSASLQPTSPRFRRSSSVTRRSTCCSNCAKSIKKDA